VIVSAVDEVVDPEVAAHPELAALHRGNVYPQRFHELIGHVPADGLILDCGGGDRRFGYGRIFNLEYIDLRLPDLFADGLALPFATDTFDLILSQAVLEHVPDPRLAADEMVRVLRPGGVIYVEAAFMQPLHTVPSHYMSLTPFGIKHTIRNVQERRSGTFGGLAVTFEWRFASVLQTLSDLDGAMTDDELNSVAGAVYLEGAKTSAGTS
jgi:SAM-dependent methyltransferase